MVDDWVIKTMYATKRRRRNAKPIKSAAARDIVKTNPSKRHRERLNSELDHVATLLPFDHSIVSKLDKLSILRLSVSYLRIKSLFQGLHRPRYLPDGQKFQQVQDQAIQISATLSERDAIMNAMNGFLFIVTADGEVYFASETVEDYLGFHQSDIIHQSVLELIHSQDRDDFTSQLSWKSQLSKEPAMRDAKLAQLINEDSALLRRSFTARFRCLLDNTSGFITLEITGRLAPLYGQQLCGPITDHTKIALFAVCSPFGPLPLLENPSHGYTFKTKHKLDFTPLALDQNAKMLLGFSDADLAAKRGYDLIHPQDMQYFATAHRELLKTGSAGLVAFRMLTIGADHVWLQTGCRVVYKNSKADSIICTHRRLTEEEGDSLVTKRSVEFKLPYPLLESDIIDDVSLSGTTTVDKSPKKTKRTRTTDTSCKSVGAVTPKKRGYTNTRDVITDLAYYYYPSLSGYGSSYQGGGEFYCTPESAAYAGAASNIGNCADFSTVYPPDLYANYYNPSTLSGLQQRYATAYPPTDYSADDVSRKMAPIDYADMATQNLNQLNEHLGLNVLAGLGRMREPIIDSTQQNPICAQTSVIRSATDDMVAYQTCAQPFVQSDGQAFGFYPPYVPSYGPMLDD